MNKKPIIYSLLGISIMIIIILIVSIALIVKQNTIKEDTAMKIIQEQEKQRKDKQIEMDNPQKYKIIFTKAEQQLIKNINDNCDSNYIYNYVGYIKEMDKIELFKCAISNIEKSKFQNKLDTKDKMLSSKIVNDSLNKLFNINNINIDTTLSGIKISNDYYDVIAAPEYQGYFFRYLEDYQGNKEHFKIEHELTDKSTEKNQLSLKEQFVVLETLEKTVKIYSDLSRNKVLGELPIEEFTKNREKYLELGSEIEFVFKKDNDKYYLELTNIYLK